MKVELISHEDNMAKFDILVEYKDFNKAVNKVYREVKGSIQIPGFRKGKAPRKLIESAYGEGIFYEDAIEELLNDLYPKAIDELDIDPIDQPKIDLGEIKKNEDIKIGVSVQTRPIPELSDLSEVEVTRRSNEVGDEEVNDFLKSEAKKNSIITQVEDREVEDGDRVNIDFKGYVDGEAFEGGQAEGYDLLIGSHSFVDDFEDQIIGKNIGDEFDVNVTFPEDYKEDLKGKDAKFEVKINSISREEIPEIDDDFAMDVSEFDTLDEYKESIKRDLGEKKASENKVAMENEAIENLVRNSNVKAPLPMVEHDLDHKIEDYERQLQQLGLSLDQYMEYSGQDVQAIREQMRPQAEMDVKANLVIDALIKELDYEVSEEELIEEYEEFRKAYNIGEEDNYLESIRSEETDKLMKDQVRRKKAVDSLMEKVKYVDEKEEVEEDN